ncbi:carotenoid isomerooxygenase-like [Aricia agestis]|uniref:carotenoid isomerooxygenase-like n=1 Tax=Aricia agestis TaxID=91739 RepID=UPI001C204F62|nr:carotenoid isomerooxygenase-like [Aricia agestis]
MAAEELYPHADMTVYLRTCEEEILEPIKGELTGTIPAWLNGTLLRNGSGANQIGPDRFGHVFDGAALLHRFLIRDGQVTYNCRFLNSQTYRRNKSAQRIVISEFGTKAVPDPCHTIFDRFSSYFNPFTRISDNAAISVYPFGDQMYALTETPSACIHRIDTETLETLEHKDISPSVLVHHTAHPHIMPNGDIYNVGFYFLKGMLKHIVVKFPYSKDEDMFSSAHIVGTMKPRWILNPAYMHSFGITENYFVIIEQPMSLSLLNSVMMYLNNDPYSTLINTFPDEDTHIVLVHRGTGVEKRYRTDPLFYMHVINCYEADGKVVVDLCSYKDAKLINAMFTEAVETMQHNSEYADWVRSRPVRLEVELAAPELNSAVYRTIADVGCELPRINYERCNGKPYKYFYAVATDVDDEYTGSLIKVNVDTGEVTRWFEKKSYPSEPIFVASPDAKEEDDGVILSAVLKGKDKNCIQLLVLDAGSMEELARVDFTTPSQATRCFHGWFLPDNIRAS